MTSVANSSQEVGGSTTTNVAEVVDLEANRRVVIVSSTGRSLGRIVIDFLPLGSGTRQVETGDIIVARGLRSGAPCWHAEFEAGTGAVSVHSTSPRTSLHRCECGASHGERHTAKALKGRNGMGSDPLALDAAVRSTLQHADLPGMVVAVRRGVEPATYVAVGEDAEGGQLTPESLFPVQSVTKLATALAVLRLVDMDGLSLDAPLRRHLPDAAASQHEITVRDLLRHTSGLPNLPPSESVRWTLSLDWEQWAAACLAAEPEFAPRTRVGYSSVAYCLLGVLIARHTRTEYSDALRALVLEPLEIEGYIGEEPPRAVAVVRYESDEHAGTELAYANSAFYRSFAFPDAGLVTTAAGALALLDAFAGDPAAFLSSGVLRAATRNQVGKRGGGVFGFLEWSSCPWGLGPEMRGAKAPHWAPLQAHPKSFGHTGDSGCLVWMDRNAGLAWVMLATRAFADWMLDPELPLYGALYGPNGTEPGGPEP